MKLKTDSYAFRFFALNFFVPLAVHVLVAILATLGPDLRQLFVALAVIAAINASNLALAVYYKGWPRISFLAITAFNILSLFAMGALSFFTSLFGWVDIVPDLVKLLHSV
ncbi:hypothetical protein [Cohaesibacter celericrescens]|uniref:Uncharacterized protein n=1 Tax=Cohaesibacter celericrescens TaxID=2067669 RepID=A0A2N5XKG4_9HYPH|nr:hypothetical protein [Cohaesibacter celericrescens]PLW74965.1 hypothetical protein C0081_21930 [Cohaesibacter celericrescens]